MIENYLRQLTTVRSRITAGNLALVFLFLLTIPMIFLNRSYLIDRFQEVVEVEVRADHQLFHASAAVSDSRNNLSSYVQGFTADPLAALEDAGEAINLLEEAAALPLEASQRQTIDNVLVDLAEYERLLNEIEADRQAGQDQMAALEAQTLQLGSDLAVRIDQLIQQSADRVEAANQAVLEEARIRVTGLLVVYLLILVVSFFMARIIQRSITAPIATLQQGAEQFRQGNWEVTVPVSGNDELTSLATTFNQMATDLIESRFFLEHRVAQRTRSLEMSAQISHNLSTILEQEAFSIAVVEQVQSTFNYYYVQLYLTRSTSDSLFLKSGTGLAGQRMLIRGHSIEKGQGIVGKAATTREVVYAPDVTQSPDWLENPLLPETKSEAAVPIISRGLLLGVLDIQHNILNGIDSEELALLQSISDQIAIALENAKLFEQLQRQADHEALLNRVTQKIQLASSVDQVLQITAQELGKALRADFTSVRLGKELDRPTNGHEKVS
jgi:nitrate/nitrite-specific signal transduction histidine kinase